MSGHQPEVADVIRSYAKDYLEGYGCSAEQRKVLRDLAQCRTQALGGHKYRCDSEACGHEKIVYNSCGNRHCPKCQAAARAEWLEQRQKDLLEVPYFHVVFTVPVCNPPSSIRLFVGQSGTEIGNLSRGLGCEIEQTSESLSMLLGAGGVLHV